MSLNVLFSYTLYFFPLGAVKKVSFFDDLSYDLLYEFSVILSFMPDVLLLSSDMSCLEIDGDLDPPDVKDMSDDADFTSSLFLK